MLHHLQSALRSRCTTTICNSSSSRVDKAVHRLEGLPTYTLTMGLCPSSLLILGLKPRGALHSISQFMYPSSLQYLHWSRAKRQWPLKKIDNTDGTS